MKIGVVLPQTEIGSGPAAIKAYAEAVEDMGFTHILVFDHVLGVNPDRRAAGRGPTRIATASTSRSCSLDSWPPPRAGSSFIILPHRQTALVAKQAAAVDVSGGRLRLGVAVGWNPVEFEALGALNSRFTVARSRPSVRISRRMRFSLMPGPGGRATRCAWISPKP